MSADSSEARRGLQRGKKKLAHLIELSEGRKSFLAQTHDYPDPDTIASALGLTWLMETLGRMDAQIGYGGAVGRAENRAMIRVLNIKLRKITPAEMAKFDLVALLDTQPDCSNHSLPDDLIPDIVVDHHFLREIKGPKPPFLDVGGGVGTTSTKVAELVRASGVEPPANVATALFYGLKSDTLDLSRVSTPADIESYLYLFERIDRKLLSEIEHPQLPLEWFRVFNKAIERGRIYGQFIVADLGDVYTPDLCAEVADRLLQIEGIRHALATGWYEGGLFLSLRTRSRRFNAGRILHGLVNEMDIGGGAGGHRQMAGARLPADMRSERARRDLRRAIVGNVLEAFGEDQRHFHRMMTRTDAERPSARPSRPTAPPD
ncbi:MAG: bifunctional oligoribonuclease/PAP phosphatase NrnA [Deltaproteobacteria bacterium]|nr:bifunctional oligoribonuclease/PAP phosphatase NrnA [Deltaproteobacteria bacterium]